MRVVPATTTRPYAKPAEAWTTRLAGLLALALLIASALTTHADARPLDEVKASGVLRVAVYESNRPFSWRDDAGTLVGIDVDLGRALATELGVGVEFIARMQGENVDTDLRANVWKGTVSGGIVADVMLHVPLDRELALRNREAVLINPYFDERIALAYDPARLPQTPSIATFKSNKVGVQLGSVSDYFIMFAEGGSLRDNVLHFVKMQDGIKRFQSGEMAAILGVRSETEGWLKAAGAHATFIELPMPGIARSRWTIGMAVKENSRDLGYALGAALDKLKAAGTLAAICSTHGVTYAVPPPD